MKNILSFVGELALVALIGLLIGFHFGGLNAKKEMSDLQASIASTTAKAEKAATLAQQIADAEQIHALRSALSDQQTAFDQQRLAAIRLQQNITSLNKRMLENERTPTVKAWADTKIPAGALDGLCFVDDKGVPNANCGAGTANTSFPGVVSAGILDGMCRLTAGGAPASDHSGDALQLHSIAERRSGRLRIATWDTRGQWRIDCARSGSDVGLDHLQPAIGQSSGEKWGGNSS